MDILIFLTMLTRNAVLLARVFLFPPRPEELPAEGTANLPSAWAALLLRAGDSQTLQPEFGCRFDCKARGFRCSLYALRTERIPVAAVFC